MILHKYVFVAGSTNPGFYFSVFGGSAMLWVIWLLRFCLSTANRNWPEVPIFPAHDKRDPWERGCSKAASGNVCACVKLSGKHLLRGKYFMAEECHIQDEVLACWREIVKHFQGRFFYISNQQQTCIIDWILWLSHAEVSCMVEGPFSRLIFIHLAPLMKQIKPGR